jgi:hypothetical protein
MKDIYRVKVTCWNKPDLGFIGGLHQTYEDAFQSAADWIKGHCQSSEGVVVWICRLTNVDGKLCVVKEASMRVDRVLEANRRGEEIKPNMPDLPVGEPWPEPPKKECPLPDCTECYGTKVLQENYREIPCPYCS